MKKTYKKLTAAVLASMMVFSAVGCSSNDDNNNKTTTTLKAENESTDVSKEEPKEDVTLKITWWGGQSRHDYTQQLLDKYTELNPHVKFEPIPAGWDGYFDKLSTQAASGAMPDIVQMDYLYISTYAKNNSLANLQEYVDNGTIDVSGIDEKLLSSGKIDDKLAGLVLSTSMIAVGYNPDVIKDAGLEEPKEDWSWDDYIALNEAVSKKLGKPSAMTPSGVTGDTNIFNYWVRSNGGSLFNESGTALGYEDDKVCADFFGMWKDMMDKKITPDPDELAQLMTLGQEAGPVVTGEAATVFEWNNYAAKLTEVNDKLKVALPPNVGDKGLWSKPGMFFSVAETSKVKDEAAKFINWFVNSEEANDIIMAERGVPVSSKVRDYMKASGKMSVQQNEMFDYVDKASAYTGETPAPDPAGISEVNEAFSNAGNSVFYGQKTPEEAAKTFRKEANAILERNNKQ